MGFQQSHLQGFLMVTRVACASRLVGETRRDDTCCFAGRTVLGLVLLVGDSLVVQGATLWILESGFSACQLGGSFLALAARCFLVSLAYENCVAS